VDEHIRRILGGETLSHEVYNLRRDGADCYMRLQEKKILLPDGTEGILVTCSDVTDQRLAEQALRESEEKYRRLFELENDAVLLTDEKTGRILETNPAAEKLYGYTRAELLAMRSADLSAEAEPADETERKRADPAPVRRHVRKDGARIPVEISASHYDWRGRKVRLATVRDVSERLRAQEEIEKQRRFLRGVIDSDPALIYVKDREGRVVLANDTFAKTFGLDQERIIGRTVFEIVPDHTVAQAMHDDDQRVLRGEVERIEREEPYVNARSEPRWAYTIRAPILGPDGKPEQLIGVSLDITVRKGEENERRKMEAQVQHTQKLESLGVLSGGIAHDFNNLLVGVLGNADLALDELPAGSVARDMLLDIRKSAQRAAELCRQLLAYSGRGKFVVERISLNAIIREMTHLLDISISKKVKTRFDLAEDLPAIEGDATQIRQVVMNLITNASEAVGDEVGTVAVRTGAEDCAEGDLANAWLDDRLPSGRYAYLEIADSGCGMDEETKRRIFDPFFTTKFMGRGLGLAAVLGIVRGHHGAIRVDSMPGRGSVFRVLFPAIEGSVEAKPDLFSGGLSEWRGHGTVLLVDDEEPVRHVGERLLTRIGFRVLTARDGVEALDLFRQHMNELKCVLVDLTMPRMDGAELFRAICGIRTDIPVVLLSGYSEQEAVKRFDGLGLAGFIQKPFEVADLLDLLRKALGGSGQAAGGTPAT
jgi:PAS domain S-box-containing protein